MQAAYPFGTMRHIPHFLHRTVPALALLLAACRLGPDYATPAVGLPATWRGEAVAGAPVWPSPDWWKGFGAPELDRLIADAQAHNCEIAAAVARVRQADAEVRIAGAPLLPALDANAAASWQRANLSHRSRSVGGQSVSRSYIETRTYDLNLSVSYELDFWGKNRASQEAAEASALFSRFDQQTVALTAVSSVAATWFTALAYQDRLAVAERNLRDALDVLAAIRGRFEAGTASMLDVSQQETEVATLRAVVPGLRNQFEQEVVALGVLVGRPPEQVTVAAGTLNTLKLPPVAPGLPSALLLRRPDVAAAEANLLAANANIRVARANFFPQIALTGSGGWESLALTTLTGPGSLLFTFAANATQAVFDNGSRQGTLEQAKGQYDELVADYRKTVVQALSDVESALAALRYATEQERLQRDAVATAQRASDIARAQLRAGTTDIVTTLQTENALFTALDALTQVRLARFLALVNLYKALGGGWTKTDVIAPPSTIFHGVL